MRSDTQHGGLKASITFWIPGSLPDLINLKLIFQAVLVILYYLYDKLI